MTFYTTGPVRGSNVRGGRLVAAPSLARAPGSLPAALPAPRRSPSARLGDREIMVCEIKVGMCLPSICFVTKLCFGRKLVPSSFRTVVVRMQFHSFVIYRQIQFLIWNCEGSGPDHPGESDNEMPSRDYDGPAPFPSLTHSRGAISRLGRPHLNSVPGPALRDCGWPSIHRRSLPSPVLSSDIDTGLTPGI